MTIRARCFIILCATLTLLTAHTFSTPNDEPAVRNTVEAFAQAWNNHDMQAFGNLFAPDADFVNVAGDRWIGRDAIQAQHAYSHGTIPVDTKGFEDLRRYHGIFKSSTLRITAIDIRFLRSDVAVAHASWELLGDTRTPNPRTGAFIFVVTRQNDHWLIASAQNTEIARTVK